MTREERLVVIAEHCMIMGIQDVVLSGDLAGLGTELLTKYSITGTDYKLGELEFTSYRVGSVNFHLRNAI